jgi:putative ABC transport system permease protein
MRAGMGFESTQSPSRSPAHLALAAPFAFVRAVVLRDWRSLQVTLVACAVAAVVTAFQYQVYTSFVRAGSVGPRFIGGAVWVSAGSIECFDFPGVIGEDYAGLLARYFPTSNVRRVAFGFAGWTSPTGRRGNVAVIGVDSAQSAAHARLADTEFIADRSDLARLDLASGAGQLATLGGETMQLAGATERLPTFLGAPYVVTSFEQARRLLRMDPGSAAYLVFDGDTANPAALAGQLRAAQAQYPELTLRTQQQFAASSSRYWQFKTGAGAAILLAAVLASLLMMILLANGVLRFLQRYAQDLLSMLGHGAGQREVWLVAAGIAVVVAALTLGAMLVLTPVMIAAAQPLLPWVAFVPGDTLVPAAAMLIALLGAIVSAGSAVRQFGPEAVFRT